MSVQHDTDRLRISDVLLLENATGKAPLIITVKNRDRLLHDDCPVIEFLVHKVDGTTGNFHAICESLLLRFQPRKGR